MAAVESNIRPGFLKRVSVQGLREKYNGSQLRHALSTRSLRPKYDHPSTPSRSLGYLEQYFCASNDSKLHNCVILTAVFTSSDERPLSKNILYPALRSVIRNSPALTLQIHHLSTGTPKFAQADMIDLDEHVTIFGGLNTEEERLAFYQQYASNSFENAQKTPAWRVFVSPLLSGQAAIAPTLSDLCSMSRSTWSSSTAGCSEEGVTAQKYEVAFVYHPSLGDATTGRIFLTSLHQSLNSVQAVEGDYIDSLVEIPSHSSSLPPALESVLKLPISTKYLTKRLVEQFGFKNEPKRTWTGATTSKKVKGTSATASRTNIRRLRISAAHMDILTLLCQVRNTTVSCLLTAVILAALSRAIPDSYLAAPDQGGECGGLDENGQPLPKLSASLIRNLRNLIPSHTGVTPESMGTYVCSHEFTFLRDELTLCESVEEGGYGTATEMALVWSSAVSLKMQLDRVVARGNKDLNTGLLKYAGRTRASSLCASSVEVCSLIGETCPSTSAASIDLEEDQARQQWGISDLGFVQSAPLEGAPFTVSCASFKGGDLQLGFSWSTSRIPESIMSDVMIAIAEYINVICK